MSCHYPRIAVGIVSVAWLSSFVIPIAIVVLLIFQHWASLAVFLTCVLVGTTAPVLQHPAIRDFFLNGVSEAVGGTTIVHTERPIRGERVLFAIHPHGLTSTLTGLALGDISKRTDQRVALVVAPLLRWLNPLMRLMMGFLGIDLLSSSKDKVQAYMCKGNPLGVVVGGFEEMLRTKTDREVIFLKNRRGFLKQAIKNGYTVIPVYCFGESLIYRNRIELSNSMRDFCAKWKIPAALPCGNDGVSFMPRKPQEGTLVVFGKPLRWNKEDIASPESFNRVHAEYMETLVQLYNRHNPYKGRQLEIV